MGQKLIEFQRKTDVSVIIAGDFKSSASEMDKSSRKKSVKT